MVHKGFQLVTIANDAGLMAKAAREAVEITRKEGGPTAAK
jgi:4-hydroxy-2-oxoheptanedioate aldolase